MVGFALLLIFLPELVSSAGEGNIQLLENEVAVAIKACLVPNGDPNASNNRQRRSEDYSRIDSTRQTNQYGHERRNISDFREQNISILNATDYDYSGYSNGSGGEKLLTSVPHPARHYSTNASMDNSITNRTKRSELLLANSDSDQCFSQCVFANLQVVDSRGIPREPELWNVVQTSVTSQQSRAALKNQIRACFQELQSEAEDNGCSYSNKLERCLMLRFADRRLNGNSTKTSSK